jgi:hypothetical protein
MENLLGGLAGLRAERGGEGQETGWELAGVQARVLAGAGGIVDELGDGGGWPWSWCSRCPAPSQATRSVGTGTARQKEDWC